MPEIFVAVEMDGTARKIVHQLRVPSPSEVGRYRQILSMGSFLHGERRCASWRDRQYSHAAPCWAPGRLICIKLKELWDCEVLSRKRIFARRGKYPEVLVPGPVHASIWDFYKHIGWDYRAKRYRDKDGNLVLYSYLTSSAGASHPGP